jgi:hypothetical protein
LQGKPDARFDEPSEGLPPWLREPVLDWIWSSFWVGGDSWREESYVNWDALLALQLAFRLEPPLEGPGGQEQLSDLMDRVRASDEFALDVIDWMLHHSHHFGDGPKLVSWAEKLANMFIQGGSAWEVTTPGGKLKLTRRALGPVPQVLEDTAPESVRAHHHLEAAWSKLVGRNPDPSGAYREAVRAVEAVAKPVVLPANDRATLGQMIAAIKDKPGKWTATLGTVDDIRAQMEAVWKGQLDRHGTDDESAPLNVSQNDADAAFSICLNLVRLFAGGHVARAEDS